MMTDEQIAHEEAMDELARGLERKHRTPRLKTDELKEVFPEILEIAPIRASEIEREIRELQIYCDNNKLSGDSLEVLWEEERREEKMKELKKKLMRFKRFMSQQENNAGVSETQIENAREYPITDLIDEGKRSGRTIKILCPMHDERTPSCNIYVDQNNFWCFGCNKGGDVVDFLMARDDIDFITAVRQLAGIS